MTPASELATKHCVPCSGDTPRLSGDEIHRLLSQLTGWSVEHGRQLVKRYRFPNFVAAVDFVNAITPVAEQEGHHPDLLVRWGEVAVTIFTHAIGGLSENDFILAARIDQLAGIGSPAG